MLIRDSDSYAGTPANASAMPHDSRGGLGALDAPVQQLFERGRLAVRNAAGDDEVEIAQVGGNIVGEPVRSDPPADVHANRGEFFGSAARGSRPNAGFTRFAPGFDAELGGSADHRFFEHAHVPDHVPANLGKVQDRVADDLSRAVIGDVAAAIRSMELDSAPPRCASAGPRLRRSR